jgi:hypothetical protein
MNDEYVDGISRNPRHFYITFILIKMNTSRWADNSIDRKVDNAEKPAVITSLQFRKSLFFEAFYSLASNLNPLS